MTNTKQLEMLYKIDLFASMIETYLLMDRFVDKYPEAKQHIRHSIRELQCAIGGIVIDGGADIADNKETAMELATICAYELPNGAKIERTSKLNAKAKWAVRWLGECLNKSGEFEPDSLPSNCDDGFLDRCRFDSAEDAYSAWTNAK